MTEAQPAGGYVVVPREPTEDGILAGALAAAAVAERDGRGFLWTNAVAEAWRVMCRLAAPPPQEPEGGALREVIARAVDPRIDGMDLSNFTPDSWMGKAVATADRILAALPSLAQAQGEREGEADGPEVGADAVGAILAGYAELINATPAILSILYDANLMPETITNVQGAIRVGAICEAFRAGQSAAPPATGWRPDREAVARLIDPKAWDFYDRHIGNSIMGAECRIEVKASLVASDAILALPAQQEGSK